MALVKRQAHLTRAQESATLLLIYLCHKSIYVRNKTDIFPHDSQEYIIGADHVCGGRIYYKRYS